MLMQAAPTDMRIPIQAALSFPERPSSDWGSFDLAALGSLEFEPVDRRRFPALDLAYQAGRAGGSYPAALNAANEVAVNAFLEGRLDFPGIWRIVDEVLSTQEGAPVEDVDQVMEVDARAREAAGTMIGVTV
jgi:1-deoxy-D-xylulose-5-phosphate reductoisomerase